MHEEDILQKLKDEQPPLGEDAPESSLQSLKLDEKAEAKPGRFGFREKMALLTALNIGLGILFSTPDMSVPGNSANLLAFLGTALAGEVATVPSLYARSVRNFWDKVFAIAPFVSLVATPFATAMID